MITLAEGSVALVVGGASLGYGPGSAIALAARGASAIAIADDSRAGWSRALSEIERMGRRVHFLEVGLDDPTAIEDAFARILALEARLDVAHNHLDPDPRVPKIDLEAWETSLRHGMKRTWLWMKHEIAILGGRGGAIVNAISELGARGKAGFVRECTNAHAIASMTEAAAKAYAKRNVRINAVATSSLLSAKNPQNTIDRTSDAMVWLSCEEARFVNGQTIAIDGGLSPPG
jgi:NAD(P)-dependent dehydrogenase (short-subunit alcohol dehydrogenase family)